MEITGTSAAAAASCPAGRDGGGRRLVPLPRRAPSGDELVRELAASPTATVADLLERTDHLLTQLQSDIDHLRRDQEEEQARIEQEWRDRAAAAAAAVEQLRHLESEVRAIAERKARTDILDQALAHPQAPDRALGFGELTRRLDEEIRLARGITGAIRLSTIGRLLTQAAAQVEQMTAEAEASRARLLRRTEQELRSEGREARASYEIGMAVVRRDLRALDLALPPSGLAWDDERWERWDGWDPLPGGTRWIRLGTYYRPELERFRFPALVPFPAERGLAIDVGTGDRDRAVAAARSIMLRLLAALPAGDARLNVIDPLGQGDSAGPFRTLEDWSAELLDGGVVADEAQIEQRLRALVRHVETVAREHLRGEYETLEQYQEALGEVVEPYRILVVLDFPTNLSDRACALLGEIIERGPRSGVHTLVVTAAEQSAPRRSGDLSAPRRSGDLSAPRRSGGSARAHGARWKAVVAGLDVVRGGRDGFTFETPTAGRWLVELDGLPATAPLTGEAGELTILGRILTAAGERARQGRHHDHGSRRVYDLLGNALMLRRRDDLPQVERVVDVSDPATWWTGSSACGLSVPLGRAGARDVAILALDGGARGGALIGGERRAGVSTLLRTAVAGWAMLYSPEEIELYLLDLTTPALPPPAPGASGAGGFDVFATEALPHARLVATEAGRELAVSVLDHLHHELTRRTVLADPHGGERAGVAGYRAATGRALARVVAVVDGAEALVAGEDRLADRAVHLLDRIVRQGPALGIHLVLATHQPAAFARLGRLATDHLRVRVALACAEDASRALLGDGNGAAARCSSAGEGLLSVYGADPGAAQRFHTCALEPHELGLVARDLRRLADAGARERPEAAAVLGRRPQVHEGRVPACLAGSAIRTLAAGGDMRPARRRPRLWLGEPLTLGGAVEVTLRREPGANLLVVAGDERYGQGMLTAALLSAALVHGRELDARVIDLMPLESGFGEAVHALRRSVAVSMARRRNQDAVYEGALGELDARLAHQDYSARPLLLVVNGLGAGPLAALEAGQRHGGAATVTPDEVARGGLDPVAALERIVREGPEVGVHVLVWTDRMASLGRHASRATMREFALRVVMRMAADDSALLVDSAQASSLPGNEALLYDEDAGRLTAFRPYVLPDPDVVGALGATVAVSGANRSVAPAEGEADAAGRPAARPTLALP